jgi:hypothetical protein
MNNLYPFCSETRVSNWNSNGYEGNLTLVEDLDKILQTRKDDELRRGKQRSPFEVERTLHEDAQDRADERERDNLCQVSTRAS